MTSETLFLIEPNEIDFLGIVHHANYLKWFEAGRYDFFLKSNVPILKMHTQGIFLPLIEMECRFKTPARYGDEITVITTLTSLSCVKMKFDYRIQSNRDETILAEGKTVHVWSNSMIEPINIEKEFPEVYKRLKKETPPTDSI